uniref:Uncharacterized protein n=1 Tax=Corethron hystrix TaxID=216773 RepID=A0A7S1B4Q7_9STRA|mmetsp:Transcript_12747/g.28128  ORF Transcript_12747/g.28128 Transcript_12747/m.28128 type:complete len:326 (+) Transcript_12747:158-1135(+)
MSYTSTLLEFGCGLIAFSPTASLLFSTVLRKPQLLIVAVTSAFAYLIYSACASVVWFLLTLLFKGKGGSLSSLIPAIVFQTIGRVHFLTIYRGVESSIWASIGRDAVNRAARANARRPRTPGGGKDERAAIPLEPVQSDVPRDMRLELNDAICSIAAGSGYGIMHGLMLYGTLLASEGGGSNTLIQPSCPQIPSLIQSAIICALFSILDVVMVTMTFVAVPSGGGKTDKALIMMTAAFHLLASLCTVANSMSMNVPPCVVSLPSLFVVVGTSVGIFYNTVLPRLNIMKNNNGSTMQQEHNIHHQNKSEMERVEIDTTSSLKNRFF